MTTKNDDASADLMIREVDEELRQEKLQLLWRHYGGLAVAVAVAVVLSVAGWQAWNAWQAKQRQTFGAVFTQASEMLSQGRHDEATAAFSKLSVEGSAGYKVLADLRLADLKLGAGDRDGAIALYERVAESSAEGAYRDLARLKAAYLKVDSADAAALEQSVGPLAVESGAWRHSAREILALAALKRGDQAKAAEWLRKIADDPVAPQGVRARATELLAAVAGKAKG